MRSLDLKDVSLRPFAVLDEEWALLVGGAAKPNPMTVSWGGLGTLWSRPVITVYVRPTRHTYKLLNEHPEFTLNLMPEALRPALDFCGTTSGRDADKWTGAKIGRARSEKIAVPRVAEARLAFECRTLASYDLDPKRFLEPAILDLYPQRDFHRVFIGEVLAAFAA